ncbi:hypothetical protein [Evansella cellulosilytica]|nr:hypothetical protein [Evansella cellulosilytica]
MTNKRKEQDKNLLLSNVLEIAIEIVLFAPRLIGKFLKGLF